MSITVAVRAPAWEPPSVTVPYEPGMNAARALELAEQQDGSEIKDAMFQKLQGLSTRFITAISGLGQNPRTNEYWFLYVNGEYMRHTGVDDTTLEDGDQVELRYEPYKD